MTSKSVPAAASRRPAPAATPTSSAPTRKIQTVTGFGYGENRRPAPPPPTRSAAPTPSSTRVAGNARPMDAVNSRGFDVSVANNFDGRNTGSLRGSIAASIAEPVVRQREPLIQNSTFQRVFIDPPEDTFEDESMAEIRADLKIVVQDVDGAAFPPIVDFEDLAVLPPFLISALNGMNCTSPLPIQAQALPIILGGHDLIGIARTGSGKTLAFLIPAVVHIIAQEPVRKDVSSPIALVLAPVRELAQQIADQAAKLLSTSGVETRGTHPNGIWAQEVYGGKQRHDQLQKTKGCSLVVATPGRLTDFVTNKDMSLERVTYFVLDEADRMLLEGFQDDMMNFSSLIRKDRHTLFFSATWPPEVEDLAKSLCNSRQPALIKVGQREDGSVAVRTDIDQQVMVFEQPTWQDRDNAKKAALYPHLRNILRDRNNKALVFVSSKVLANELAENIGKEGIATEAMHGGHGQCKRDDNLARFKTGEVRLLVATDVMGRGLDIPTISHVVIYDMGDIDDYVHRIGRTARGLSELSGHALTLFEYDAKWPELAGALVEVLQKGNQRIPQELQQIAEEVRRGVRQVKDRTFGKKNKASKAGQIYQKPAVPGEWIDFGNPGTGDWKATGWVDYGASSSSKTSANSDPKPSGAVGPMETAKLLGVDDRASATLAELPHPVQQEILSKLSDGLAAGNINNPSGFVVKNAMNARKEQS